MRVFTSLTRSYLPKARVLARSVKRFHPDWQFHIVLSDDPPAGFDPAHEPFDGIVTLSELGIPGWKGWVFGHTVVELCTAVKAHAARLLVEGDADGKLMYLDPDIRVFNSLQPLADLLDAYDILLTPHLLDTEETEQAVADNEICALQHGAFNLGFFAVRARGEGRRFLDWWAARLLRHCIDDIPGGLFTDQRWCDLAPGLFERLHVVRDRGCNVATWNIHHRSLSRDGDGVIRAAGTPLRFYHFTGHDSGDGLGMLQRYAAAQKLARAIWQDYAAELAEAGQGRPELQDWRYGRFDNGEPIPLAARRLYRRRADLQTAFPDPFRVADRSYWSWWQTEGQAQHAAPQHAAAAPPGGRIVWSTARRLGRMLRARARARARA